MADVRLSPADQVLVNAALCLVLPVERPDPDEAMALDIIRRVIGEANAGNPIMAPIVQACRVLSRPRDPDKRLRDAETVARISATWELQRALQQFSRWRLAGALDLHRKQSEGAA